MGADEWVLCVYQENGCGVRMTWFYVISYREGLRRADDRVLREWIWRM